MCCCWCIDVFAVGVSLEQLSSFAAVPVDEPVVPVPPDVKIASEPAMDADAPTSGTTVPPFCCCFRRFRRYLALAFWNHTF